MPLDDAGPGLGDPTGGMPPGGASPAPSVPKSPIGGPGGPGSSPMLSPGGGAGNRAAAVQQVKAVLPALLHASMAFDAGSKEQQALIRAVQSLNPIFGKAEGAQMVPAGLQAMAMAQKGGGGMSAAPPPGVSPSGSTPPDMQPPAGGAPGG